MRDQDEDEDFDSVSSGETEEDFDQPPVVHVPEEKPKRLSHKPHETRIRALCVDLQNETRKHHREYIIGKLYENISAMTRNIAIKKYGKGSRIDIEDIVHSVTDSAIRTVVLREKDVFSWVLLVRKMTFDWANKWMKTHLYSNETNNVTLSEPEDDRIHNLYYNDLDSTVIQSYLGFLRRKVQEVADSINSMQCPRSKIIARLALEIAVYGDHPMLPILPIAQRSRVKFFAHKYRQILLPLFNYNLFSREFL